jgi:Xaa-Pro aminopeptidase
VPPAPDSRADRLAAAIAEDDLDALIVGDLVRPGDSAREAMADLRWLTGFGGSSGLAVVGPERRQFVTDFRYLERVGSEVPAAFEAIRSEGPLPKALGEAGLSGRVGFDETRTSVRERDRLTEALGEGVELVPAAGFVERLRRAKDALEIDAIGEAAKLIDAVLVELLEEPLRGRSEREVALWIERRIRELGGEGPSFQPIVAAGPHGALPHAEPSEREIGPGELVVIDCGAILDGYCSDCTRTPASGEPSGRAREVYELVLDAQERALDAIRAGAGGRAVDAVAREAIADGGHGEHFGHGLGHGVGIEVHEAPRLSPRSEDTLLAGDVVTVEPGVYLPGEFGVRIEDLVAVGEEGIENLSSVPKQLRIAGD